MKKSDYTKHYYADTEHIASKIGGGESFVDQSVNNFFGVRYTFSAKEKDVETGYGYFGARYYSSDLSIWLSVDPLSDNTPSSSAFVYCINNPIKVVDPNGEDWYESEDGTTLSYVYGKTDDIEGYKHLGAELDKEHGDKFNNGGYSTLNLSANLTDKDFVTQMGDNVKSIMSCAKAAGAMSMKRGGKATSYANELPMVTEGKNGRAGDGISSNLFSAVATLAHSLLKGIPIVAGVDYHEGSPNDKKNGGDGMTDHYVAITGISLSLTKGSDGHVKYMGGSFQYANPGNRNSAKGLSSNNVLNFNSNGWRASDSRYVLTTMRVK